MSMLQNVGIALRPPHLPPRSRKTRLRWWLIVVAIIVATLLAFGIAWAGSLAPVTRAELVGSWSSTNGEDTTTLVLRDDGRATVSSLQAQDLLLSFDGSWVAEGSGITITSSEPVRNRVWNISLDAQRFWFQPRLVNFPDGPQAPQHDQVFFLR